LGAEFLRAVPFNTDSVGADPRTDLQSLQMPQKTISASSISKPA
jgi:hypothetical protein